MTVRPAFSGDPRWHHDGPVLLIADIPNRIGKRLLDNCLEQSPPVAGSPGPPDRIDLDISGEKEPSNLQELEVKLDTDEQTLLVPVRVAWLMPGAEQESNAPLALRHLVFGDPRRPGNIRGRWIIYRDPERAQCIAGEPATIAELRSRFKTQQDGTPADTPHEFAAFVARQAALALEISEWRLIGRRYKVPRFIAQGLRGSPGFRDAVRQLSDKTGRPLAEMYKEANGYMKEVIGVPSAFFIDVRARFDNWVLSLGYNKEVVCPEADLEELRSIVQTRPTMLLFTHKTYIDSIALTAKLFEKDFPMLHIFAGANMGFAGLGFLIKRSGGIFIRRSFQNKPLYKIVLRHYIGYLMEKRFPMTWAFEGTRSRTGKLMPPRYGLLKYVLEAAHTTGARDIHVIPVTVSYDLMRDVKEYASEQTGKVKKPESLKWFIGYLSSLKRPMGRMYLDFGKPVVLDRAPDPGDRMALPRIAFEVADHANKVTPITLPAIGCMVLLGAAPRALTNEELQADIIALVRWALARGIRVTSDFRSDRLANVDKLANSMVDMGLIIRYDEGSETVFGIEPGEHPVASYYRNTIIHHFVNKAILELALLKASDAHTDQSAEVFWRETKKLRNYFKFEFFYPKKKQFRAELKQELSLIDPQWEHHLDAGGQEVRALLSNSRPLVAHASLLPFVEAYSLVFDLLARLDAAADAPDEKEWVNQALRQGKQAYLQRRITSEASIGKILFSNGFKLARNLGLTQAEGADLGERRSRMLKEFKELSRRLEIIRLMALSDNTGQ
jgi:glycerol-3-phosphate O-acyltransferase